jgi:hypothetical protein
VSIFDFQSIRKHLNYLFVRLSCLWTQVGYNNLALATDFEFPAKKEKQQQIQFPKRSGFQLSAKLNEKLRRLSRKIKVLDRITIKIKDNDLNTFLHHLVSFFIKFFPKLTYNLLNFLVPQKKKSKEIMKFDIVALSPSSSNVLQVNNKFVHRKKAR